eukprot:2459637-Amphidinium_carterae.2
MLWRRLFCTGFQGQFSKAACCVLVVHKDLEPVRAESVPMCSSCEITNAPRPLETWSAFCTGLHTSMGHSEAEVALAETYLQSSRSAALKAFVTFDLGGRQRSPSIRAAEPYVDTANLRSGQ